MTGIFNFHLIKREANITDIFRFFACMAVIWYHSQYYGLASGITGEPWLVNVLKASILSFSMPFFYITTIYFTFHSLSVQFSIYKITNRIINLLKLLSIYCLIYELPVYIKSLYHRDAYYFLNLSSGNLAQKAVNLFYLFIGGNHSPAYFLAIMALLYLLVALFIRAQRIFSNNVPMKLFYFILMLISVFGIIFAHRIAWTFSYFIFLYLAYVGLYWSFKEKFGVSKKLLISNFWHLIFLCSIIILGFGSLGHLDYLYGLNCFVYLGSFIFLFMNNWIELADFKIARVLSYLGQEYSLGVFLWHNFFQIFITFAMIRFDRFLGFSANHISYILINIMTAVLSLLFIYFVKKHYRLNKFLFNI